MRHDIHLEWVLDELSRLIDIKPTTGVECASSESVRWPRVHPRQVNTTKPDKLY